MVSYRYERSEEWSLFIKDLMELKIKMKESEVNTKKYAPNKPFHERFIHLRPGNSKLLLLFGIPQLAENASDIHQLHPTISRRPLSTENHPTLIFMSVIFY